MGASDRWTTTNRRERRLIQAMASFGATHCGLTWDQAIDQWPTEVQAIISAYWQAA